MLDCIFRTVKEEGILSLWRGNGSSVLRYYPSVALNFSLKATNPLGMDKLIGLISIAQPPLGAFLLMLRFSLKMKLFVLLIVNLQHGRSSFYLHLFMQDLYKNILRNGYSEGGHVFSGASANFIAGAAAGCTTLILIYPLDIAHTRLAADIGRSNVRQFRGIYHFLSTIREKDGIQGIYRGLPASLQGMIVHRGLYFGGFDTIKEILSEESKTELTLWKRWVVAQAVTTSAGLLSYPLDTVRRRMMMQSGLEQPMYHSTLHCWKTIYRTEGVSSFYRGALSNIFRSTGAAAILVLYDEVKKFMKWGGL
ncbi:hypothetical protein Godav_003998 [Gossypium davidsonii]|uniref:ADP/ATP translocase n=2 Tax=Gossypium TaxID=3633 RepID=A0A7J8SJQ4_GOSDV|nr:hypothetical protein [Gossypium davidsonii]MBA0661915.1 hypothetical protein [Gossypium klotzschianum]